jgi:hypothetical protein
LSQSSGLTDLNTETDFVQERIAAGDEDVAKWLLIFALALSVCFALGAYLCDL